MSAISTTRTRTTSRDYCSRCEASINEVDYAAGFCTQCKFKLEASVMQRNLKVEKVCAGYYRSRFPVTLTRDGKKVVVTATLEISKREDGSGWSYDLKAPSSGFVAYLSTHEDIYESKSQIVEFFKSEVSRYWEYVPDGGLNSWCLGSRNGEEHHQR